MGATDEGRSIAEQVAAGLKKVSDLNPSQRYALNEYNQKASGAEANALREAQEERMGK